MKKITLVLVMLMVAVFVGSASVVEAGTLKITAVDEWGNPLSSVGYYEARAVLQRYEFQSRWVLRPGSETPKDCASLGDGCADYNGVMYFNNLASGWMLVQVGAKYHQAETKMVYVPEGSLAELDFSLRYHVVPVYPTYNELQVTGSFITVGYWLGNNTWKYQQAVVTVEIASMGRNSFHAVLGQQEGTAFLAPWEWQGWKSGFALPQSMAGLPIGTQVCATITVNGMTKLTPTPIKDPLQVLGQTKVCGPKEF